MNSCVYKVRLGLVTRTVEEDARDDEAPHGNGDPLKIMETTFDKSRRRSVMSTRNYLGASILALALVMAGSASALAGDSHTLKVPYGMMLKGTQLAPGEYSISWVAHSSEATVTVAKKKKVVATAQGRLVDAGKRFTKNAVLYDENADGSRTILEIRLAGSTQAIVFD